MPCTIQGIIFLYDGYSDNICQRLSWQLKSRLSSIEYFSYRVHYLLTMYLGAIYVSWSYRIYQAATIVQLP